MADLLSQKLARKLLEGNGWTCTKGGKHNIKMEKPGMRPITLPMHGGEMYGKGLSAKIRKEAGLDS
jgi:predicted RNA binding protein YcfA (HicA-like mRNA interferase family)